jgi:hypothetical protein
LVFILCLHFLIDASNKNAGTVTAFDKRIVIQFQKKNIRKKNNRFVGKFFLLLPFFKCKSITQVAIFLYFDFSLSFHAIAKH